MFYGAGASTSGTSARVGSATGAGAIALAAQMTAVSSRARNARLVSIGSSPLAECKPTSNVA